MVGEHSLTISIIPPKKIQSDLQRLCFGLPNTEWIEPGNFHIPLRSFGKVEGTLLLDIQDQLKEIITPCFEIELSGVGFEKSRRSGGSVWIKVKNDVQLLQLRKEINNKLRSLPIENETYNYHPYLYLGYFDRLHETKMAFYLEGFGTFCTAKFLVEEIHLLTREITRKRMYIKSHAKFPLSRE